MAPSWGLFLVAWPQLWDNEVFSEVTGIRRPIYMDDPVPAMPGLFATDTDKQQLREFVQRVQHTAGKDQKETVWSAKRAPAELRNRLNKWAGYVKKRPGFTLHRKVQDILVEMQMDHWAQLAHSNNPRDLKSIDMPVQIIVGKCGEQILELLFDDPPRLMGEGLSSMLTMLVTIVTGGMRSEVNRTLNKIEQLEKGVEDDAAELYNPKIEAKRLKAIINSITTNSTKLIEARAKTRRAEDEEKNTNLQERMKAIRDAMESKKARAMPDETFRMIAQMTNEAQLEDERQALDAALEAQPVEHDYEPVGHGKPMENWNLDDELGHLNGRSRKDIYISLGIPNEHLPTLTTWRDQYRCHDTWTEQEDPAPEDHKVPAELKWHQVVGLRRMAEAMMAHKSLLVLDEVGVGKTLQVLALIAYRILCFRSVEVHNKLCGDFAKDPVETLQPGIVVIVLPPTLIKQWRGEIETWFRYNSVFIAEYTTKYSKEVRRKWWEAFVSQRDYPAHHKIVLASRGAVFTDAEHCFTNKGKVRPEKVENTLFGAEIGLLIADEIHEIRNPGHRLTTMMELRARVGLSSMKHAAYNVKDPVQIGRIMGVPGCTETVVKQFERRLRQARTIDNNRRKADGSAVNVERAKALRGERISTEEYEVPKAQRECIATLKTLFKGWAMRRTIRSLDNEGNPIWGADPPIEIYIFGKLYEHERKAIAERVAEDIDDGDVGQWQSNFYYDVRKILVHVNFYRYDVARAGKDYTGPAAWQLPQTLEEYQQLPSTKIDLAVEIIKHHLAMTGAAPLVNACLHGDRLGPGSEEWDKYTNALVPSVEAFRHRPSIGPTPAASTRITPDAVSNADESSDSPAAPGSYAGSEMGGDGDKATSEDDEYRDDNDTTDSTDVGESKEEDDSEDEDEDDDDDADATRPEEYVPLWDTTLPDKIVVYSFFTQQQQLLKKVLEFHGIHALLLHGSLSRKKRAEVLQKFRQSPVGCVLIVTSVGITGLNLDCANIVIFLSSMWSGQEDRQFIGRVWRSPQTKPVLVYRPLAMEVNESSLSNIAFSKEEMHDDFISPADDERSSLISTAAAEALLKGVEEIGVPGSSSNKGRGRGRGRGRARGARRKEPSTRAVVESEDELPVVSAPSQAEQTPGGSSRTSAKPSRKRQRKSSTPIREANDAGMGHETQATTTTAAAGGQGALSSVSPPVPTASATGNEDRALGDGGGASQVDSSSGVKQPGKRRRTSSGPTRAGGDTRLGEGTQGAVVAGAAGGHAARGRSPSPAAQDPPPLDEPRSPTDDSGAPRAGSEPVLHGTPASPAAKAASGGPSSAAPRDTAASCPPPVKVGKDSGGGWDEKASPGGHPSAARRGATMPPRSAAGAGDDGPGEEASTGGRPSAAPRRATTPPRPTAAPGGDGSREEASTGGRPSAAPRGATAPPRPTAAPGGDGSREEASTGGRPSAAPRGATTPPRPTAAPGGDGSREEASTGGLPSAGSPGDTMPEQPGRDLPEARSPRRAQRAGTARGPVVQMRLEDETMSEAVDSMLVGSYG
ncbi:hypothetical protein PsYK624_160520 [Phanerochaete sordida]|uniref:P-loop containing nucleoside triphosphate hydrolase protein n=1 Tax=Phanerochaete sordida TaxID=48140 RepID=A0A9P3GS27_9APHY|nr:hypothetical protein PsYK624_160520 [Phanerochaete sordida]